MIGMTFGLGTIYTADRDITECSYELPQEIILEDEEIIIFEGCD